ncbi:MAG: HDIG domain-containing metalloprotein [Gemmatimonadota bacterium]
MGDRDRAWALLTEYTESPSLRNHALAVEAAMRAYARRCGEDQEKWGVVGLLHDFDYERWPGPDQHPVRGAEILRQQGYPEDVVNAVLSHAPYTGVPRDTAMARALFAVDELAGFLIAVALVRPSRSLLDVKVSSVRKKLKQPSFAAAVSRQDIEAGARALGVELDEHLATVIEALQGVADRIGLAGGDAH